MNTKTERELNRYFKENEAYYKRIHLCHDEKYFRRYMALLKPFISCGPFLDVGCGTGWVVQRLHTEGSAESFGIDISFSGISLGVNREKHVINHSYAVADARALPFPSKKFALVGAMTLLEHSYYPKNNLKEMIRVLRPGGRIVLCHTNFLSPFSPLEKHSAAALLKSMFRNVVIWEGYKRFFWLASKMFHFGFAPQFVRPQLNVKEGEIAKDAYFPTDPDAVYLVNPIDLIRYLGEMGVEIEFFTTWAAYSSTWKIINIIPFFNMLGPGCSVVGRKRIIP